MPRLYIRSYGWYSWWYYNSNLLFICLFSVPSFLASFKRFWSNETGKGSLSKVVQWVRNYLHLNFQKDWSSMSKVMADIRDGIIIRTSFLSSFFVRTKFSGTIWALLVKWNRLRKLKQSFSAGSKLLTTQFSEGLVKYVRSYYRYSWWYYNSYFFFFCTKITGIIWVLWSNETGKGSLSKVVQRLKYYLYINFH